MDNNDQDKAQHFILWILNFFYALINTTNLQNTDTEHDSDNSTPVITWKYEKIECAYVLLSDTKHIFYQRCRCYREINKRITLFI